MTLPRNVFLFEVLLYASLMLDSLSVAVQDRTPTADVGDQTILVWTILDGGIILLFLYFVWLAAHHRKNWPRWVLTVALGISVMGLFAVIGDSGLTPDIAIEAVSCVLTAAGLFYSFTGDARGWFNA